MSPPRSLRSGPPKLLHAGRRDSFPDPRSADEEGLVAVGGDLRPWRLMLGYRNGIFPWYNGGVPPLWWSPDPRAVMSAPELHISRSLSRVLRQSRFRVTCDRAFDQVIHACASDREEGTWLLPEMIDAYLELFALGHAHSFEAWAGDVLVGGLYGVGVGRAFAAESMFHRARDASKVALVTAVTCLFRAELELFDVQFLTDHLVSLGAYELPRDAYLDRLTHAQRGVFEWDKLQRLDELTI